VRACLRKNIRGLIRENHRSTTKAENDNGGIAVGGKSKKAMKLYTPARFGTRVQVRVKLGTTDPDFPDIPLAAGPGRSWTWTSGRTRRLT
jgi:hypothetical protein